MIEMKVFSRLSKTEKIVGLGLLVLGGVIVYELVKPKPAMAATLPTGQPTPLPRPAPSPQIPSGGGGTPPGDGGFAPGLAQAAAAGGAAPPESPGVAIITSPYQSVSTGATSYIVTTSAPASDPSSRLKIRQGPGVSYPTISWLMKGDTVGSSGSITKNPVDGYSWTIILDKNGQQLGWAATAFLTAGSNPATLV